MNAPFEIRTQNAQWPDLNLLWSGQSEHQARKMLRRKAELCRRRGYTPPVLFFYDTVIETAEA